MPVRSYTSIKMFHQCAAKYKALVIDKSVPFTTTTEQQKGIDVHAALEKAVKDGTELLSEFKQYQPVVDYLQRLSGKTLCEKKLGIKTDLSPCGFFDEEVWYRGTLDVLNIDGQRARIFDYKHGNDAYQDNDQLKENAILVFQNYPEIDTIQAVFIYLAVDRISEKLVFKREDLHSLVVGLSKKEVPMVRSEKLDSFPTNKTHLCNYCQVTTCQYHNRG